MRAKLALAIFVLVIGCAGAYSPQERLVQSTIRFYEAYRWKEVEEMKRFVPPDMREEFVEDFNKRYKGVSIVDYEVVEVRLGESKKTARVTVNVSWHPLDETVVRSAVFVDTWASIGSGWVRTGQEVLEGRLP